MKKPSVAQLSITLVLAGSGLAMVLALSVLTGKCMSNFTRDATAISGIHPLSGCLSALGILLWCATASVLAFVSAIVRSKAPRNIYWFLLMSAILSGYLMLDDLFLFHEGLAGMYLGIKEIYIFMILGVFVLAYLICFHEILFRTRVVMLVLAFVFLGASILVDVVKFPCIHKLQYGYKCFCEDGLKWLGISCWCSYYISTARQLLRDAVDVGKRVRPPESLF